jgi:hypothetical protein
MDLLVWLSLAAGAIGIAIAATAHVEDGFSLARADSDDSRFYAKLISALVISLAAIGIGAVVILKHSYSANEKKAAWACVSAVVGFWMGKLSS